MYDDWQYTRLNNDNFSVNEYTDFNWKQYVKNYDDLSEIITKEKAWKHWKYHGRKEGRSYLNNIKDIKQEYLIEKIDEDFDWQKYIENYEDISINIDTREGAWNHWINHGKFEGRIYFCYSIKNEFNNFDWENYVNYYKDLSKIKKKEDAWYHWINYGKSEERIYFTKDNSEFDNFDWQKYIDYYIDLTESGIKKKEDAWYHWINHGKREERIHFHSNNSEFDNFDWQQYISNYNDLYQSNFKSKEQAWYHWINHGKSEGRSIHNIFEEEIKMYGEIKLINYSNIYFKHKYDRYGNHFFGWKGTINQLVDSFINTLQIKEYRCNIFFDEWIEKLLLWGNRKINTEYLRLANLYDTKMITFVHNPPFLQWYDKKYREKILHEVLVGDDKQFNKNLFTEIHNNNLDEKIIYLYTLSIYHKEYISNNYPDFADKVLSIHHPIDLDINDEQFNINDFLENRNIFHIGWWLRNFKTFIDLKPPNNFKKKLLVKNDFKKPFEMNICKYNDMSSVEIVEEVNNEDYAKIFKNSCIFVDILDCIANNTILECIKFNTPIIVRRTKSAEEYLGTNYPLFYNSTEELLILKEESFFLDLIIESNNYLKKMNKNHLSLSFFNKKINYDIEKLEINTDTTLLTWISFVETNDDFYLEQFIQNFINQNYLDNLQLILFIRGNNFVEMIDYFSNIYNNITYVIITNIPNSFIEQIKISINYVKTRYCTILDLKSEIDPNYSSIFTGYLNNTPTCDIAVSPFSKKNKNYTYKKSFIFSMDIIDIPTIGVVWRKNIYSFLNNLEEINLDKNFWKYCLESNLNIRCVSKKILYSINN